VDILYSLGESNLSGEAYFQAWTVHNLLWQQNIFNSEDWVEQWDRIHNKTSQNLEKKRNTNQ